MGQRLTVPIPDTGNLIPRIPGGSYLDALPGWTAGVILPIIDGPNHNLLGTVPWNYSFLIPDTGRYALALEFSQDFGRTGGLRLEMAGVTYNLFQDGFYGFTRGAQRAFFLVAGTSVLTAQGLLAGEDAILTLAGLFKVPPFVRLSVSSGQTARWEVPA